jgi:hypothetical protein
MFPIDQICRLQLEVTAKERLLEKLLDIASRDGVEKLRVELEELYRQIIRVEEQGIAPSNYPLSMQVSDLIARCDRFMKQES